MRSRRGIIFISIIIVLLAIVLALLVNHLVCQKDGAPQLLLKIDTFTVNTVTTVSDSVSNAVDYVKYIFLKATAEPMLEYPGYYLPLYENSRVTSYNFNQDTNTLNMVSKSRDSFEEVYQGYVNMFANDVFPDSFKQYKLDNQYIAYGTIGNFTFLMAVEPTDDNKYNSSISINLHYYTGDELSMENFFRQQQGTNASIFADTYIYPFQKSGEDDHIYFQLRDYKSQQLGLDTHVEIYLDDVFYESRYYGDTIRVPIEKLYEVTNIKMVSFDNTDCIRGIDIMEDFLCYNAAGYADFYNMAELYSHVKNLFIVNTDDVQTLNYFQYFTELESLHIEGNNEITDYSPIINLSTLEKLYIKNIGSEIINNLNRLENLDVLEISNCQSDINLGEDFADVNCREIALYNCPNLYFEEFGLFNINLEKLSAAHCYSLENIGFLAVYPNIHILEISNCDNLKAITNTHNLPSLNSIKIKSCPQFDLSQPLDNMPSLMRAEFINLPVFGAVNRSYFESVWSNDNLVFFDISSCGEINDFYYEGNPWKQVN